MKKIESILLRPLALRAVLDRKQGKMKFAYYLEVIADQRERVELA